MGVTTEQENVDEHLMGIGYAAGVLGVVRRYKERIVALNELGLRWVVEPRRPPAFPVEFAMHPGGVFWLETDGAATGQLTHLWAGWGRSLLETGDPEHLRLEALRILRRGGPFGSPTSAQDGEQVVKVFDAQAGTRRAVPDGSELRGIILNGGALNVRIWPNGKFAHRPKKQARVLQSQVTEGDAEHLSFGSTRMPWCFTDVHPLLGTIRAAPYELLLCGLQMDVAAIVVLREGELLGLKVGSWDELRAMDAGPWLAELAASRARAGAAREAPKADPGPARETPTGGRDSGQGEASTEASAPGQRRRAAAAPGGMPGRRERRVRLKPALAAAVTRHLADVAARLPTGVLGAAFAVVLLRALEAAALGDLPTQTGTTTDLFSRLHKRGLLATIPADQAGRAGLKLLAALTPFVRRLHYRRWCFAFGDMHEPASELRRRLGPIPGE